MYTRDFGGIKSEGQLYNLEREYNESYSHYPPPEEPNQCEGNHIAEKDKKGLLNLDFLRNLKLDDLILIGIGILLLLDSDSENDILVFLIVFLLIQNF